MTIPRIWITIAISILIHALALWQMPMKLRTPSESELGEKQGRLSVRLVPRRAPPPSAAREPPPRIARAVPRPAPPPRPAPRPAAPKPAAPARPPVLAMNPSQAAPRAQPAPPPPTPPERSPAPSPAPSAPPAADLASLIEARRRARGESVPSAAVESAPSPAAAEDPNTRANRIAAANLGLDRKPTFDSGQSRRGGGVFQIERIGYDYAEFYFYGWNKDIRRNTQQLIEVRKGSNPDIRIAIVRRMIGIIRDYETGDFVWDSQRSGRKLTLSARQRDNAGLEEFLMHEFFD